MSQLGDASAVVLAAGAGQRLGADEPKAFVRIGGRPLVAIAAAAAAASKSVGSVVVAVPPGSEDRAREMLTDLEVPVTVVPGGATRQESVVLALAAVPEGVSVVVCHDAARPFARPDLFSAVIDAIGEETDGAVPVVPIADTVKRIQDGRVVGTESREGLALAQTPQAFRAAALRDAHERAAADGFEGSDDALLLERAGYRVRAIEGERTNLKITTPDDIRLAEALAR